MKYCKYHSCEIDNLMEFTDGNPECDMSCQGCQFLEVIDEE